VKYAFIQQHNKEFRVSLMCSVLGIPRSGYYEWQQRPENPHFKKNRQQDCSYTVIGEASMHQNSTKAQSKNLALPVV